MDTTMTQALHTLDIIELDSVVHYYCSLEIAPSTTRTYPAAMVCSSAFCVMFHVFRPFPVDELLLRRSFVVLAKEGLALVTLRTNLSGIRHARITRDLPETSRLGLPCLKLSQSGVAHHRVNK